MTAQPNIEAAETFIWLNARLIDRHRYAFLFKGGGPEPVHAALLAYRNADGGFGHALEPDSRGWSSQPGYVLAALRILDEIGRCEGQVVADALGYLESVTAPNGGVPVALASVNEAPKAPWWEVGADANGALLPTASIAGLLLKNAVAHPWVTAATAFCWDALVTLEETHPYEVEFSIPFLDHVPDRDRATHATERLGRIVLERQLVGLDPDTIDEVPVPPGYGPGEIHTPLDYAPTPDTVARQWFTDEQIERALDALAAAQQPDGGWPLTWRDWNTATTIEWRAIVTIEALLTLRAYGQL